jgi:hypothetical protein
MPGTPLNAFLPRVEDPIPDTIGLGAIFSAAGVGGVLLLVLASLVGLPDTQRDAWGRKGMVGGFLVGSLLYVIALAAQLV